MKGVLNFPARGGIWGGGDGQSEGYEAYESLVRHGEDLETELVSVCRPIIEKPPT